MSALRRQFTPALVISILALVVALSGTAYAALVITGANVKNGTLTGVDVKANALTGTQIDEAKLGTVPKATSAGNATTATSATTAGSAITATNAQTASMLGGKTAADFLGASAVAGGALTGTFPNPTIKPVTWTLVTPLNSWEREVPLTGAIASYTKDAEGFVHLRGAMRRSTANGAAMFNLPAGFRPERRLWIPVFLDGGVISYVEVATNGDVIGIGNTAAAAFTSLEGVVFYAS